MLEPSFQKNNLAIIVFTLFHELGHEKIVYLNQNNFYFFATPEEYFKKEAGDFLTRKVLDLEHEEYIWLLKLFEQKNQSFLMENALSPSNWQKLEVIKKKLKVILNPALDSNPKQNLDKKIEEKKKFKFLIKVYQLKKMMLMIGI